MDSGGGRFWVDKLDGSVGGRDAKDAEDKAFENEGTTMNVSFHSLGCDKSIER